MITCTVQEPDAPATERRLAGRWWLVSGLAWLVLSAIVLARSVGGPHSVTFAARVSGAAVLGIFAAGAAVVGFLAQDAVRRSRQAARVTEAARPIAEADRMRTALLVTVSHDLRSPLAAARAAVSGLRAPDGQLAADDHDELLAVVDESLGRLARLTESLLDVSRLQSGALPVFPRPADLGEIIASSLGDLGPPARAVDVDVPCDLPDVMVDPAIMERVVVNLAGNALRHAPAGSPLLVARALGDRVELRVIDRGPGIPEADRERAFMPFQRLGEEAKTAGVGLGLAVSRGLTEAMGGTVQPEETPGGGLTMSVSLPAAPVSRQVYGEAVGGVRRSAPAGPCGAVPEQRGSGHGRSEPAAGCHAPFGRRGAAAAGAAR